ncbi:hypothetical protein LX64_02668 [Chitinophaga skermanii]|uniref:Uncharacterized protein n=1 Tax=Chitinophaga skermanii TaxID=331697 RepID=A0A327QN90_9BACT|nr:hypothetical protein [Chitinophaga skermanii]RAJ05508.1 hypothetical protein LX64_02668 [Chitinophaga skermanii]
MDKTASIIEWLSILKRRPLMIISDNSFCALKSYIEGYVDGLGLAYDIPKLTLKVTEWYQRKTAQKSNVLWGNQIVYFNPNKTDEELKQILVETAISFFEENPGWQKI